MNIFSPFASGGRGRGWRRRCQTGSGLLGGFGFFPLPTGGQPARDSPSPDCDYARLTLWHTLFLSTKVIRPLFDPAETEVQVISFSRNLRQRYFCFGVARCDLVSRLSWNRLNDGGLPRDYLVAPGGKLEKEGGRGEGGGDLPKIK